jgi:hypothetical protein
MTQRNDPSAPNSEVEVSKGYASVSLTAAAAGNYDANDIVSNSATGDAGVANVLPVGGKGEIVKFTKILAKCSEDSVTWRLRLHFYDINPTAAQVEMDDQAAADFAKVAAGRTGYKGYIDLPAMVDGGTVMAFADAKLLSEQFACAEDDFNLYFIVQTLDAETNEAAGMTLTFDCYWE